MDTNSFNTEMDQFYAFLGELRLSGETQLTPEESLQRFRENQEKLQRFHERNDISLRQSQQGLSQTLDLDAVLERVERRIGNE